MIFSTITTTAARQLVPWLILISGTAATLAAPPQPSVRFDQDIRPILADRCFPCHGPDAETREADLRLDVRSGAFADRDDGMSVIRSGDLDHSLVYWRITSADEDERMPPSDSELGLSANEIDLLKTWITEGAAWDQHWSFRQIENPPPPDVVRKDWPKNEIDRFVLKRLEQAKIEPAPVASRRRLIRRVSLDLTGLPPTPEEIDAFENDPLDDAYARLVDRLLASPRFGEQMAVDWLDVARYADTYGYQADVYRDVWPWRDWVVRSINDNLPFDKFVTWQLAGDLLPNATQDQILATAFNRLHRQTNEGGSVEEEFRVAYVSDRVNTFSTAMLGLTLQCARCHEHKFDPVTQEEYYQLSAFFNNIDECGLYSHFTNAVPTPTLLLTDAQQQEHIRKLDHQINHLEQQQRRLINGADEGFQQWLADLPRKYDLSPPDGDYSLDSLDNRAVTNRADKNTPGTVSEDPQLVPGKIGQGLLLSGENNISVPVGGKLTRNEPFSIGLWINTPDVKERAVIFHRSRAWTDAGSRGYQLLIEKGRLSASLIHFWPGNAIRVRAVDPLKTATWIHVVMTYDGSSRAGGLRLYADGRPLEVEVVRDHLYKNITGGGATTLTVGQRFRDRGFKGGRVDELQVFRRCLSPLEVAQRCDGHSLEDLCEVPVGKLTAGQQAELLAFYVANQSPRAAEIRDQLLSLRRQRSELIDGIREIMVMQEMEPRRPTYLLRRGAYDARDKQVQAGVPSCLPPWPTGAPRNRLGLAQWLTDPQHPLLARVTVNRIWQSMFGRGLVTTAEDLGSQGTAPTHPQLLDWLARRLIDDGWDIKATVRRIVLSATYRQDSLAGKTARRQDPGNRLLSRFPRHRLSAETIRDSALYASGLLVEKIGGPPVKPYQPEGLWKEKSGKVYRRDVGEGSHRRSIYGYWKRTSPPPSMMIFDAAKRDVCVARRQTTATPLQALVLWNDPQYVEAARGLAQRVLANPSATTSTQRLDRVFCWLTGRHLQPQEQSILERLFQEQTAYFEQSPEAATRYLSIGDLKVRNDLDQAALAALSSVAHTLLSYDETITNR